MRSRPDHEPGPSEERVLSPELEDAVQAALLTLTANQSVFVDEVTFAVHLKTWSEAALDHPWLTPELIDQATKQIAYRPTQDPKDKGKLIPVGDFIDTCRLIKRGAEAKHALPPPPAGDGEAGYERFREMAKRLTGRFPDGRRFADRTRKPDDRWRPPAPSPE